MKKGTQAAFLAAMLCTTMQTYAYDSGSTGADGDLVVAENTVVTLPADGVLNYTRVQIPVGVRVSFKKNANNTPVRMLVSGDVVIAGTLTVSGSHAAPIGTDGDGDPADDGNPGLGGPGGYDGGAGGRMRPSAPDSIREYSAEQALAVSGEWGHGPGGGAAGRLVPGGRYGTYTSCRVSSGNYSDARGVEFVRSFDDGVCYVNGRKFILPYGTPTLLPLIGGSGGGGGQASRSLNGGGGGGGGGALLIAASGAVNITGTITADGGYGARSGTGSGGAIRIIATAVSGRGSIFARSGNRISSNVTGRIRIETESMKYTGNSRPQYILGTPGSLYLEDRPSVRIASVGAQNAPTTPSGSSDITFAEALTGDVSISLSASNVPIGTVVTVNVVPAAGTIITASSTALAGTLASSTATATVALPAGPSTLQAVASFEVRASDSTAQSLYTPYTGGELVAHVSLGADGDTGMTLTTASGREIVVPR